MKLYLVTEKAERISGLLHVTAYQEYDGRDYWIDAIYVPHKPRTIAYIIACDVNAPLMRAFGHYAVHQDLKRLEAEALQAGV